MHRLRIRTGFGTAIAAAALLLSAGATSAAAEGPQYAPVCSHALPAASAGCDSIQLLNPHANWHGSHAVTASGRSSSTTGEPSGYYPAELRAAYGLAALSTEHGAGQTVAIVDAYNDPNAEADLNAYRAKFGLPPCTAEGGCFRKVNQAGEEANYPNGNTSWSEEISLDLDMVSAVCPNCHILLVEATSNSMANLATAARYAAAHAQAVSNSYGGSEFSGEREYDASYEHAGVAVTVSSGDNGYGVEYPASSAGVTAVGGTTLRTSTSTRGWNETVWSGAGAGCSAVEPNPGWQPLTGLCGKRSVADTAADANPNTGVAVYDTYGQSGWLVFGGTSVASPIVASVYALAENAATFAAGGAAQGLYGAALNRVREGTDMNAKRCGSDYLCSAKYSLSHWKTPLSSTEVTGWYNGPTGNGTPSGITGF